MSKRERLEGGGDGERQGGLEMKRRKRKAREGGYGEGRERGKEGGIEGGREEGGGLRREGGRLGRKIFRERWRERRENEGGRDGGRREEGGRKRSLGGGREREKREGDF